MRLATPALVPLLALGATLLPLSLSAQLRPLPEVEWGRPGHEALCGAGFYGNARAALAGEEGRLLELGACRFRVDLGGAALQVSGVGYRRFHVDRRYAAPLETVEPAQDGVRSDLGDWVIETLVPLTPRRFTDAPGAMAGLRLGARLPTTDDRVGLERDATDVHGALMIGYRRAPFTLTGEAGVAINGSRNRDIEQQDVLIHALFLRYRPPAPATGPLAGLELRAGALGHVFWTNDWSLLGNENLGEARLGVRVGQTIVVDLEGSLGWTDTSPDWGLVLRAGWHPRPEVRPRQAEDGSA